MIAYTKEKDEKIILTEEELMELEKIDDENKEKEKHVQLNQNSIKQQRCYWCNKTLTQEKYIIFTLKRKNQDSIDVITCDNNHKQKVLNFYNFLYKWNFFLSIFILIIPILLLVPTFIFYNMIYVFPIFISLGLGLLIIPSLGGKIISGMGLKNSITLARVLGLMLITIGITLFVISGHKIFVNE